MLVKVISYSIIYYIKKLNISITKWITEQINGIEIIKSNLYNNSKKIKNYKLLGVKTSDIYKFFILENIIMNLIVLFIAIILINYFIFEIKQIEMFKHIFKVSLNNIINCFTLIAYLSVYYLTFY